MEPLETSDLEVGADEVPNMDPEVAPQGIAASPDKSRKEASAKIKTLGENPKERRAEIRACLCDGFYVSVPGRKVHSYFAHTWFVLWGEARGDIGGFLRRIGGWETGNEHGEIVFCVPCSCVTCVRSCARFRFRVTISLARLEPCGDMSSHDECRCWCTYKRLRRSRIRPVTKLHNPTI